MTTVSWFNTVWISVKKKIHQLQKWFPVKTLAASFGPDKPTSWLLLNTDTLLNLLKLEHVSVKPHLKIKNKPWKKLFLPALEQVTGCWPGQARSTMQSGQHMAWLSWDSAATEFQPQPGWSRARPHSGHERPSHPAGTTEKSQLRTEAALQHRSWN